MLPHIFPIISLALECTAIVGRVLGHLSHLIIFVSTTFSKLGMQHLGLLAYIVALHFAIMAEP